MPSPACGQAVGYLAAGGLDSSRQEGAFPGRSFAERAGMGSDDRLPTGKYALATDGSDFSV